MSSAPDLCESTEGVNPLDETSVHPESYEAAKKLLEKQGFQISDITGGKLAGLSLTIQRL